MLLEQNFPDDFGTVDRSEISAVNGGNPIIADYIKLIFLNDQPFQFGFLGIPAEFERGNHPPEGNQNRAGVAGADHQQFITGKRDDSFNVSIAFMFQKYHITFPDRIFPVTGGVNPDYAAVFECRIHGVAPNEPEAVWLQKVAGGNYCDKNRGCIENFPVYLHKQIQ